MERNKVSIKDFASTHNTKLNRRGQKMSQGYLYRLIRNDIKGTETGKIWFKYILEGDKQRIYIEV